MNDSQLQTKQWRLLIVITRSVFGGAQKYVLDLATALSRNDYSVKVACQGGGPLVSSLRDNGIGVIELEYMQREISPRLDTLATAELIRVIRSVKPDIIHLNSSKAGMLGRIAGAVCRVPVVYSVHGWAFREGAVETARPLAIWSERLIAPLCARFIAPSQYEIDVARRFRVGRESQFVCVPNGIEPKAPHAMPGGTDADGLVRVCMVARFERPKRQDLLIQAISQVPGSRLILVGDGEQHAACEELARTLGISDRVQFMGNRSDVADILANVHIGVLSTDMEALPITLLEAMRAGLPVLGTRTGGVPEVIEYGVNGYMGPPNKIDWMVDALSRLVSNPALRKKMGAASRARFEQRFTLDRMIQETTDVYRTILQRG